MISVIIPTLNAERHLAACLTALVPAAVEGFVREVIAVDGGSSDRTLKIADQAGIEVVTCEPGRGRQLRAGGKRARSPWLLFLHADSALAADWEIEASAFIRSVDLGSAPLAAAVFRFALDDRGAAPRLLEMLVAVRSNVLAMPYGDQGLLIPRRLYDEIGGYRDMPLMEDVDIVRRLGRRRIVALRSTMKTSAERYRRQGYARRVMRNQLCLALYAVGVSPNRIASIYADEDVPATQGATAAGSDETDRPIKST